MIARRLQSAFLLRCVLLAAVSLSLASGTAFADVEISAKPTVNMSCAKGVCKPTGKSAVLNVNALETMLAVGNTTIKSKNNNPDIVIDAELNWASIKRLTLDSYHSIAINKLIQVSGSGALVITTNDGGADGDYRFYRTGRIAFSDLLSKLIINANRYVLANSYRQLVKLGKHTPYVALADNVDDQGATRRPLQSAPFVFEGLGNSLLNVSILAGSGHVGLFSEIGGVRDLNLINISVTANGDGTVGTVGGIGGVAANPTLSFVKYCYVSGKILVNDSPSSAGGLLGSNIGIIVGSRSDASVTVTTDNSQAGGLVGVLTAGDGDAGAVTDSYATGTVAGGNKAMVGGLVGHNLGAAISNSYATGPVTGGENSDVGGLVGSNEQTVDTNAPAISSSYSTGPVTGGTNTFVGGFVGNDLVQTGNSNDYWDLDTSGIGDSARGAGNVQNDPGITGLTAEQFTSGLPAGFDPSIWKENADLNNGYPYLRDIPPSN